MHVKKALSDTAQCWGTQIDKVWSRMQIHSSIRRLQLCLYPLAEELAVRTNLISSTDEARGNWSSTRLSHPDIAIRCGRCEQALVSRPQDVMQGRLFCSLASRGASLASRPVRLHESFCDGGDSCDNGARTGRRPLLLRRMSRPVVCRKRAM